MTDNRSQEALTTWLGSRLEHWHQLESKLKKGTTDTGSELEEARKVLTGFRSILSDLSLARRNMPGNPITRYLESLFLRCQEVIYRPPGHLLMQIRDLYNLEIPWLMRQMIIPIAATFSLFVVAIFAGWLLVSNYPDLAALFASPEMIDNVQQGKLWTDDLLNIAPSSLVSFGIITNNIAVSLFAFALGSLYGLGTLYVISLNGLMLGGIFAFTAQYHLAERLFKFIIGHGVVELSVIIIAGAMGLRLGEALIRPGNRNRQQAFQETTMNAGKILLAAIPFLILAGIIEGFISPDDRFGMVTRVLVGTISGAIFWFIMLFGLPSKHKIANENQRV